jgi:pumilio RNA-binding family
LSKHKFASNVIELCFCKSDAAVRLVMLDEMLGVMTNDANDAETSSSTPSTPSSSTTTTSVLLAMVRDPFANYVVQKLVDVCSDTERSRLLAQIQLHSAALRRIQYGKHLIARVEKLLSKPLMFYQRATLPASPPVSPTAATDAPAVTTTTTPKAAASVTTSPKASKSPKATKSPKVATSTSPKRKAVST